MEKEIIRLKRSMRTKRILCAFLIFSLVSAVFYGADSKTPAPYTKDEFPGFMHDLRRAEIITLGAMPFITFNVTLGYSFTNFAIHDFNSSYFVNPFANSSDDNAFQSNEQVAIIVTSLCLSAGIGLTDFIVHSAKRSHARRKLRNQKNGPVDISPIFEDPDAVQLPAANAGRTDEAQSEAVSADGVIEIPSEEEFVVPGEKK